MGRWGLGMVVAALMASGPALGHKSKRTDPCGCHHQYGLRHCHPTQKSPKCEAPVRAKQPVPQAKPPAAELDRQPQHRSTL
jgi:hypothetical protein